MELCNDPTGWLSADDIINMIMQVMHIHGMFFVYQKHIKYENTRFRYSASTNIQLTVNV